MLRLSWHKMLFLFMTLIDERFKNVCHICYKHSLYIMTYILIYFYTVYVYVIINWYKIYVVVCVCIYGCALSIFRHTGSSPRECYNLSHLFIYE